LQSADPPLYVECAILGLRNSQLWPNYFLLILTYMLVVCRVCFSAIGLGFWPNESVGVRYFKRALYSWLLLWDYTQIEWHLQASTETVNKYLFIH